MRSLFVIILSYFLFPLDSTAQEVSTSYKTIYMIGDEGLLDKFDAEERNIITLKNAVEEWHFFFEKEKLIAFECQDKNLLYKELFETSPNIYKDQKGELKLYSSMRNGNEIAITIETNSDQTDLYFKKNNNEQATFYFKKMVVNKSKS